VIRGSNAVPVVAQLCALDGCGQPVTGRLAKFCCRAHQRRASRQRALDRAPAAVAPQEALEPPVVGETPSAPPAVLLPGPLERLAGVAALLPPGWRLEATSASVTVSWSL
jgi:hypothetical protein